MSTEYVPQNDAEQYYYDALWRFANPSGACELSGKAAILFFKKSAVDVNILVQLWGLSFSSVNIQQFYSAIRYITLMQHGEIPLSRGQPTHSLASSFCYSYNVTIFFFRDR